MCLKLSLCLLPTVNQVHEKHMHNEEEEKDNARPKLQRLHPTVS